MTGAKIHDNDLIYVKQCHDVPNGTIAVVLIEREEVTIKRIIKKYKKKEHLLEDTYFIFIKKTQYN